MNPQKLNYQIRDRQAEEKNLFLKKNATRGKPKWQPEGEMDDTIMQLKRRI